MASIRQREWTTGGGKKRSGWEVSWYRDGKRKKKVFTGAEAKTKARRLRGQIDSAEPEEQAKVADANADSADSITTVEKAGKRWVGYVERELGRERSTWTKYRQHL